MPFLLSQGAEPIPGYKLVKKLGVGGYGEVWEATAPGGLAKAIKIIFGQTGDARAEQELKALNRIKEVRHPFLLSLERYEINANQVFIVMELADSSLMDRYEECRRAGLPGIPRDELLQYLRDAADALDYMNENYGLQHLDIKPQNLLLVGRRIKIADFGLVKDLCGTSVTATGGVTPLYASPEAFDAKVSRFSDQYSLAIVYQEMLTGYRPFPGKTTLQLAFQHVNSPPLLDPLPAADRPIIARALSKSPEQRFPTCREMVENLYGVSRYAPAPPAALPSAAGQAFQPDLRLPDSQAGKPDLRGEIRPPTPPGTDEDDLLALDTMVGSEPSSSGTPPPVSASRPKAGSWPPRTPSPGGTRLRPTLFLGIGGLAARALRRLRHRLHLRFGGLDKVPVFQILLLDTDRAGLRGAQQGKPGEALTFEETLLLPLHRPEHYRAKSRDLLQWLDRRWLYGIPRSQLTEGMRSLGRLAFVDHADEIHDHLRRALARIHSAQARAATSAATGLEVREEAPRVFLLAGISGGTGGGMVFDAAFAVRQVLAEHDPDGDALCALLLHATGQTPTEVELARVNAYAALTELHHFSRDQTPFPGSSGPGNPALAGDRPFDECYLLHLGDHLDEAQADAATDGLAEYLFYNAATPIGAVLDEYRAHRSGPDLGITLRTFGLSQVVFPRHLLAEAAGHRLCQQLVLRWLGTLGPLGAEMMKEKTLDRLAAAGLAAEALTDRLHATVKQVLGQDPEAFFQKVYADWAQSPAVQQRKLPAAEAVRQVQGKIRSHLGGPAELNQSPAGPPALVESALEKQALELGEQLGRETVDWFRSILEDPDGRLQAAGRAAGCLADYLAGVMDSARALVGQYRAGQDDLRERLAAEWTGKGTGAWFGKGRRQGDGSGLGPTFLEWCWLRLKELVLDHTLIVFKNVSSRISKFNQELSLCRERLEHFAATLTATLAPPDATEETAAVPGRTALFPEKAQNLREAADVLFRDLPGDFSLTFDRTFQAEVLAPRGGLWTVVSKHFNPAEVLREELDSRCRAAVLALIQDFNAADMFLDTLGPEKAGPALRGHLDHAVPLLAVSEGVRHYVVAVPAGPAGDALKELAGQVLADMPATVLRGDGDILVCCEAAGLAVSRIAGALIGQEAGYREIARQVLTRTDVRWTPLPVE